MHNVNTIYLQFLLDTAQATGSDIGANTSVLSVEWPNVYEFLQYVKNDMVELGKIIKELEDILEGEV